MADGDVWLRHRHLPGSPLDTGREAVDRRIMARIRQALKDSSGLHPGSNRPSKPTRFVDFKLGTHVTSSWSTRVPFAMVQMSDCIRSAKLHGIHNLFTSMSDWTIPPTHKSRFIRHRRQGVSQPIRSSWGMGGGGVLLRDSWGRRTSTL